MNMTLDESRAYLYTRLPLLAEVAGGLESRGLELIRFSQSNRDDVTTGTLKFAGLLDESFRLLRKTCCPLC